MSAPIGGAELIQAERPADGGWGLPGLEVDGLERTTPAGPHCGRAAQSAETGVTKRRIPFPLDGSAEKCLAFTAVFLAARLENTDAHTRMLQLQRERDTRRTGAHDADVVFQRIVGFRGAVGGEPPGVEDHDIPANAIICCSARAACTPILFSRRPAPTRARQ